MSPYVVELRQLVGIGMLTSAPSRIGLGTPPEPESNPLRLKTIRTQLLVKDIAASTKKFLDRAIVLIMLVHSWPWSYEANRLKPSRLTHG